MARQLITPEGWCGEWDEPSAGMEHFDLLAPRGRISVVFDSDGTLFWRIQWDDLYGPMYNGAVCWSSTNSGVLLSNETATAWYEEPMSISGGDPPSLTWNGRSYVPCGLSAEF